MSQKEGIGALLEGSDKYYIENSQKVLMYLLEELTHLLNQEKINFWIDWGTMLGFLRHHNIIPWDNDCDLCMLAEDYDRLIGLFEQKGKPHSIKEQDGYKIGRLVLLPRAYNDDGCLWLLDSEHPNSYLGIDVIRYVLEGQTLKNCMNETTNARYPCAPGSGYDFAYEDIFPLRQGHMLGLPISVPNKLEEIILRGYGPKFSEYHPISEYEAWASFRTLDTIKKEVGPCFKLMREFNTISEGLEYFRNVRNEPFLVRQASEFSNLTQSQVENLFNQEEKVLSWYETETELFNEIYEKGEKLLKEWKEDKLKYNIVDAPNQHIHLLPGILKENLKNLNDIGRIYSICYALTKKNNLTKYHEDLYGDGWVYLFQGTKVWHIIDKDDIRYLEDHGYSLMSIKEMNLTELVQILDGYLWNKIWVGSMASGDFIYFPQKWAHRVITYDKSFGICGYSKA